MHKTKLIIEIDKFFAETYGFCDKRDSCTVPICCKYYGSCSGFLRTDMSKAPLIFYHHCLDGNPGLPNYNYFKHQLNGSHYFMYEASCDFVRRFWYLERRFRRSRKSQRYMKALKILDNVE